MGDKPVDLAGVKRAAEMLSQIFARHRTLEDHEGVRAIGGDKARRPFRGQKFEGALQPQDQLMPVADVEITPRKRLAP